MMLENAEGLSLHKFFQCQKYVLEKSQLVSVLKSFSQKVEVEKVGFGKVWFRYAFSVFGI